MDPVYLKNGEFTSIPESTKENFMEKFKEACLYWAEITEQEKIEASSPFNELTTLLGVKDAVKWM